MHKKKIVGIVAVVLIAAAAIGAAVWWFFFRTPATPSDPADIAYVTAVRDVATNGGLGTSTKFAGVVEPQRTLEVQKDESKKIGELYVTVGQEVQAGDKLFSYDMDDLELQLQDAQLQLQTLDNRMQDLNQQINTLIEERNDAPEDERYPITLQIQSTQLELRSTEYDRTVKAREIEQLSASVFATDVTAEMGGIIQSINDGESGSYDPYGNPSSNAYITILATGEYRVKATVTELNIGSLREGMEMRVISRADEADEWSGYIDEINYEPVQGNSNGIYYGTEDSFTPASKYNFFVKLDRFDGLMLGQHVYVEPSVGSIPKKTGIWLPGYYIFTEEMKSYVWAVSGHSTLEKREVSLGQYDEELDEFEILSGLKEQDLIAVPTDALYEGMYAEEGVAPMPEGGAAPQGGEAEPGAEFLPDPEAAEDGFYEDGEGFVTEGGEDLLPEEGENTADPDQESDISDTLTLGEGA